jgi:acetyl esterase/lipase
VAAGVRWTRAHSRRLGVDPRRIGLVGSSSGGHLALLAGLTPGAPEHAGTPILGPDGAPDTRPGDESVAVVLALYPVADPLARYRYVLGREHEPAPASGFDAQRLLASHRAFFADEAAMAGASVTRLVAAGQARALPPVWVAQPELDDNVPAGITDAFVAAYLAAGGAIERTHFPGVGHGFIGKAGPDTDKALALMRDFIGRHLAGG